VYRYFNKLWIISHVIDLYQRPFAGDLTHCVQLTRTVYVTQSPTRRRCGRILTPYQSLIVDIHCLLLSILSSVERRRWWVQVCCYQWSWVIGGRRLSHCARSEAFVWSRQLISQLKRLISLLFLHNYVNRNQYIWSLSFTVSYTYSLPYACLCLWLPPALKWLLMNNSNMDLGMYWQTDRHFDWETDWLVMTITETVPPQFIK